MLEVDVVAVADLCSRFLPGMVERGEGAVLNVASTAAFQPLPGQAGYGAAKAFVLSYTRSISAELKGTGVTATVLCPGPVSTGFGEAAGFTKEEEEKRCRRSCGSRRQRWRRQQSRAWTRATSWSSPVWPTGPALRSPT